MNHSISVIFVIIVPSTPKTPKLISHGHDEEGEQNGVENGEIHIEVYPLAVEPRQA